MVAGFENGDVAEQLNPGQCRPVLVVAIDRERGARSLAQPAQAREFGPVAFGLVVNDRPDRPVV
jgi:hypothetical protein